jgi:hypothetical protein
MKISPFQHYSKPAGIDDGLRSELIYNAMEKLAWTPLNRFRIGDIVTYLNNTHKDIEFDMPSTARLIYEMGNRIGWLSRQIDGVLCPVCAPRCPCEFTTLAVYNNSTALAVYDGQAAL